ncbi:Maf family protein [Alicyclobacillus fastidiosus]|uniref:Maf family protein n=1 Tax=Alicyclobacillus fastidiosus TaxID=392011 RepID=UPI0023E9706A|nr:septum formation protein Maf [Alicyclobacillus fastidiosus]
MDRLELILASGSPRRRQLLEMLSLPFQVIVTDADEEIRPSWAPGRAVEELAERKLAVALSRIDVPNTIAIAADTVVVADGTILGKPKDENEAYDMLQRLRGTSHEVFTGVAVYNMQNGKSRTFHEVTRVWMYEKDEDWLRWYIATGEPMDKAGSYAIQGVGSLLVERIEGDYFNVVGLPIGRLALTLEELGAPLQSLLNDEG